ncbi:hypothetical protein ASZ90_009044 [hydrocarbon metagenome]|uniref:Uncharacterized protein n=1 Tax=hydrocarbon metagenome TaxID=938273 RepID=A0A0W8FK29_9ZZZZ
MLHRGAPGFAAILPSGKCEPVGIETLRIYKNFADGEPAHGLCRELPCSSGRSSSCFIPLLLRQVRRLNGASRTCYSHRALLLLLQSILPDVDCRAGVAVVAAATVRADPRSMRGGRDRHGRLRYPELSER